MEVVSSVADLRTQIKSAKQQGKVVGFVPTMGFLHEGHLSLMKKAKQETDLVVTSIFVNPTQFGPNEDFASYPRNMERDTELTQQVGTDILFTPTVEEMYPEGCSTFVEVEGEITKKLCGRNRPGHFRGVTTVVSKLFNLASPDFAYFGKKDAQQVAVIEKMARDLYMNVAVIPCPTVREKDGLAMSSRNSYLSDKERDNARVLSQSLFDAEKRIKAGERQAAVVKQGIIERIQNIADAKIDYVELVEAKTLENIVELKGDILIALAVKIGKTRLIDNIDLSV